MRQLFRALSGSLVLITIATLLLAAPAAASASLMTFGFDGFLDCSPPICTNETVAVNERLVTAIFTIDTDAPDLNPDPQIGRYEFSGNGTGLSINLGGLTLFQSGFSVNVFNDQFGAFCGFGPGHQLRDMVTIVGSGGANNAIGIAVFDTCDTNALSSDALLANANLELLHSYSTGPGEGLVVNTPLVNSANQFFGNTLRIYRVPEPDTLTRTRFRRFRRCRLPRSTAPSQGC